MKISSDITIDYFDEIQRKPNSCFRLGQVFASLIDVMDIAVWELGLDYRIIACNNKAREVYGEKIIGHPCYAAAAVKQTVCPDCPVKQVFQGDNSGRSEHQLVTNSGEKRYIDHIATPIHNEQGKLTGALVLIIDITHRKRLEDELREHRSQLEERIIARTKELEQSNEKYRALIMQSADCLILHDLHGKILEVNPCSCDTYGYTREELLRMKVSDLDEQYTEREEGGAFWERISPRQSIEFEARQKKKDGTIFPVEVRLSLVQINDQTLVLGLCRDISKRKQAEEERERLEAQFQQVQKLESIGRLAGGVAHDLNNLLVPILGYSEMLMENTIEKNLRKESLEGIASAGKRARNLVQQLLAFSRKQTLKFKSFNLNDMIKNFESLLRRTISEDITIHVELAPSLPFINGDVGQLEQIIMNLAVNAQDAMPNGGKLSIETSRIELDEKYAMQHKGVSPGVYVMLAVSDTGCGMDKETREHLFEPFFTTKTTDKGTGLGLATVYGIVKQHGGNIWFYSEPGLGSTFKIYLPTALELRENSEKTTTISLDLRGSETILLVEDNEQVKKLVLTILERNGYKVLEASGGREALRLLARYDGILHLLLTDVVMPEMNGKQLFEKVSENHPATRVLYMSGYTDNVIAHHGILKPNHPFIQKPFSKKSLLTKVKEVLTRRYP